MSEPEPWLRGPVPGIAAELQPAAHALLFAREEIDRVFARIGNDQLWQTPAGAASIGYHMRHCAGSIHRMLTYARGGSLSREQFAELAAEKTPDLSLTASDVARIANDAINAALDFIRTTDTAILDETREVGRKRLPASVRALIYEIVVHTARHIGQMATTARIVSQNTPEAIG